MYDDNDDLTDFSTLGFLSEPTSDEAKPFDSLYRFKLADAWRYAQMEYEGGQPAKRICRAYGLSLSTFRTRARNEGWRRADMMKAGDEVEHDPVSLEPPPAPPTPDLVDLAWRSAAEAIRCGKVYEARAWMRLVNELKSVARNEAADARMAEKEAARAAEAAKTETLAPELHLLHPDRGVQDGAPVGEPILDPDEFADLVALEQKAAEGLLSPDEVNYVRMVRRAVEAMAAIPSSLREGARACFDHTP